MFKMNKLYKIISISMLILTCTIYTKNIWNYDNQQCLKLMSYKKNKPQRKATLHKIKTKLLNILEEIVYIKNNLENK